MQAQTQSPQQARDPRNRPVALETPKDQYNKHLEAARTRSGPLSHKQPSPRHTSPANGNLIFLVDFFVICCHLLRSAQSARYTLTKWAGAVLGMTCTLLTVCLECHFMHPI